MKKRFDASDRLHVRNNSPLEMECGTNANGIETAKPQAATEITKAFLRTELPPSEEIEKSAIPLFLRGQNCFWCHKVNKPRNGGRLSKQTVKKQFSKKKSCHSQFLKRLSIPAAERLSSFFLSLSIAIDLLLSIANIQSNSIWDLIFVRLG